MSRLTIPDSFANLPASVEKIQKLYAKESINAAMLVELLEKEPILSANILKLVNSAHYGLSRKVTSVNHAVMLLGSTIIRGIVLASVLKKSFPIDLSPYGINIDLFDKISILRSKLATLWLKESQFDHANLSSAAFLMESGKIILANEIVKSGSIEEFVLLIERSGVCGAERELFLLSSYEAAAKLFKSWLFSDEFVELIAGVAEPQTPSQQILRILVDLINTQDIFDEESVNAAHALALEMDLEAKMLLQAIEKMKKDGV